MRFRIFLLVYSFPHRIENFKYHSSGSCLATQNMENFKAVVEAIWVRSGKMSCNWNRKLANCPFRKEKFKIPSMLRHQRQEECVTYICVSTRYSFSGGLFIRKKCYPLKIISAFESIGRPVWEVLKTRFRWSFSVYQFLWFNYQNSILMAFVTHFCALV